VQSYQYADSHLTYMSWGDTDNQFGSTSVDGSLSCLHVDKSQPLLHLSILTFSPSSHYNPVTSKWLLESADWELVIRVSPLHIQGL